MNILSGTPLFHLCIISPGQVRPLNLSLKPINLPTSNPSPEPLSRPSLACFHLSINCKSLPSTLLPISPSLYLFSRTRALQNNDLPATQPPLVTLRQTLDFRYLLILDLKQSPSIFALFIQSFFCRRPE